MPSDKTTIRVAIRFLAILTLCTVAALIVADRLGIDGDYCGIDDANIFFVYGENLSNGHGFVYNIGSERVEGFTSILWVIFSAVSFRISSRPEFLLLIVSLFLLSSTLTIVTVWLDSKQLSITDESAISWSSLFFLAITLASPGYIAWTTLTLMDVGIWSALLVILSIVVLTIDDSDHSITGSILLFFLLLTRPESIAWGLAFVALIFLRKVLLADRQRAFKAIKLPVIIYCVTIALLTIFRLSYFGYPLPNTYYAKVSPDFLYNLSQGVEYLRSFVQPANHFVFFAFICSLIQGSLVARAIWRLKSSSRLLSKRDVDSMSIVIITWTGLLIPVLSGGDHFGSHRFYQALYPVFVLNIIDLGYRLVIMIKASKYSTAFIRISGKRSLGFAILLVPLLSQSMLWYEFGLLSGIQDEFQIPKKARKVGAMMNELFADLEEHPRVGVIIAGGIKVEYPGPIFDLMGLNNTAMGHSEGERKGVKNHAAFDENVFFDAPPQLTGPSIDTLENPLLYNSRAISRSWANRSVLNGLYDRPEFLGIYRYARISRQSQQDGTALAAFVHRDFLDVLRQNPTYRIEVARSRGESADND